MPSAQQLQEQAVALLRQRFPEVARAVESALPLAAEPTEGTPETTLICQGVHLTSCVDRRAEAQLQAREIPVDAPRATVYGLGLGDLPRVLLERTTLRELDVVLLNPALFLAQNRCAPLTFLSDPRLRLLLGRDQTRLARPFAVAPACLRLAEDAALELRDRVLQELTLRFQQQGMDELNASLGTAPEVLEFLHRDEDVARSYGSHPSGKAVVVGGGPSLESALPHLRKLRGEVRLIAVTTALRVLSRAGLVPDYAVAVDRRPELGAHFDDLDLEPFRRTPLVYLAGVHPRVLERWTGPRIAAFRAGSRDASEYPGASKGELFCAGTVTHAAVDLAVRLGAREVTLVGADFCFASGKAHAGTAPLKASGASVGPSALNGHGERVPSTLALLGYLRDLEAYIASTPQVRFFKWGREGAELRGATWLP